MQGQSPCPVNNPFMVSHPGHLAIFNGAGHPEHLAIRDALGYSCITDQGYPLTQFMAILINKLMRMSITDLMLVS